MVMSVPEGASSETTPIRYVRGDIPDSRVPSYWGDRYHTETPDALDLQDRAALCINCLTEVTDSDYPWCQRRSVIGSIWSRARRWRSKPQATA